MRSSGCACRSWIQPLFTVTDAELLRTAGLDALIFHRAYTFGLLFFAPITLLGLCACEPLHLLCIWQCRFWACQPEQMECRTAKSLYRSPGLRLCHCASVCLKKSRRLSHVLVIGVGLPADPLYASSKACVLVVLDTAKGW